MKTMRYTKTDYMKSSPHFFRLIGVSVVLLAILLLCGSVLIPAPLMGPADAGAPPNPAKSAWFLLWVQELVSHGNYLVYPVLAVGALFLLLPWLPLYRPAWRASWLPKGQKFVNTLTIAIFAAILSLTIVAAFFRGPQWQFVLPF
jgi:hypothetical protein